MPVAAFSALSRANKLGALVARQQVELNTLRAEIEALGKRRTDDMRAEAAPAPIETATPDRPGAPSEDMAARPEQDAAAISDFPAVPSTFSPSDCDDSAVEIPAPVTTSAPQEAITATAPDEPSRPVFDPPFSTTPMADSPAIAASTPGPAPASAGRDLEESIGSRWAVWVGGVALALGGLFLVRYSIEAGFFGPGVRLLMGAVFSLVAAGASEYLRRRPQSAFASAPGTLDQLTGANIPAVLAGVSVLSAFGVVYAAHGIYGFIGPTLAFLLMGVIGLAALTASLLHGTALGLFGLVGSYATPLLVSSSAPSLLSLSLFIAFVTAVAFLMHARRPDRNVTLGAVAGHGVWTFLIARAEQGDFWSPLLVVVGSGLALALLLEWPRRRETSARDDAAPSGQSTPVDEIGFSALAVPLVLSGLIWTDYGGPAGPLVAVFAATLAAIVAALRYRGLASLAPLAAAAATGVVLLWPTSTDAFGISPRIFLDLIRLSFAADAAPRIAWTAALLALLVGVPPLYALLTSRAGDAVARGCLAFASGLGPVFLLLATALRSNGLERSTGFAALALLLCGALFAAAERLLPVERRNPETPPNPADFIGSAAYAASASLALGLSVAFALRETWLVVGFAIAAAGVALVASVRPLPLLRAMSAALATAAIGRLIWSPIVADIGSWPLLNWLIPAYAAPALCFAIGAFALRDRRDRPRNIHEALAAFFAATFVLLEIRQFFAGADLLPTRALLVGHYADAPRNSLFEEAVGHVVALGLLGAAFQQLARRVGGPVFQTCADIAAIALIVLSAAGLGACLNPLFDGTTVNGPVVFNRLLLYVVAGGALGCLAMISERRHAPSRMSEALGACAALLISLGAALMVRRAFAGPRLVVLDEGSVGFTEVVMATIVLLALVSGARIWREASSGRAADIVVRLLAWLAMGWAVLGLGLWRNPLLDQTGVAGPVVFNRILWGYGAAALAFAGAAFWLREAQPIISRSFAKIAGAGALLMLFLLMRHGFHGPFLASRTPVTLAEAGCYAMIGFAAAILLSSAGSVSVGGRRIEVRTENAAAVSCGLFGLLSGLIANPLATGVPLSGPIILDNVLIGYLLPSLLAFVAARRARAHVASPMGRRIFGGAAIIGALIYILIEVRRGFVGPVLFGQGIGANELYAYSAAILLYGVALLALGFRLESKDLRLASLGVITIAICKAFLVDMAGLQGLLRALSFIGLGTCLVGVGLAYQHLLRRDPAPGPASRSNEA